MDAKIEFLRSKGVDVDTGINNMMDYETYDEMLNDFYDSLPEELSKIDGYKNQEDMSNYAILVHAMKSNARSFGFNKLGEISYNHEMASKANDSNYVNQNYNEFKEAVKEVQNIIESYKNM